MAQEKVTAGQEWSALSDDQKRVHNFRTYCKAYLPQTSPATFGLIDWICDQAKAGLEARERECSSTVEPPSPSVEELVAWLTKKSGGNPNSNSGRAAAALTRLQDELSLLEREKGIVQFELAATCEELSGVKAELSRKDEEIERLTVECNQATLREGNAKAREALATQREAALKQEVERLRAIIRDLLEDADGLVHFSDEVDAAARAALDTKVG